jgi:geranylgeranyl pyrophosphate synthase
LLEALNAKTSLIYRPVKDELREVEAGLMDLSKRRGEDLSGLLTYLFERGGKGLRPAITLLAAKVFAREAPKAIVMATAVELLHIATLIHDDTVDNSPLRRGKETISNRWGQNVAILLGDYVFAASATFVCDTENIPVIRRFSETIMDLSSGQLMEYFKSHNLAQDREVYKDRIYRKTASLFQTSGESGAILAGGSQDQVKALSRFGYNIGIAFQIVDDILDVKATQEEIGKPVGNDLLQGVLTLPTIMLLERQPKDNPIANLFAHRDEEKYVRQAMEMIQSSTIIDECYDEAEAYCVKARESLEGLPQGPALASLQTLSDYVTERRH